MSINFFADLAVVQFRAWVGNRCLNSILECMDHSHPTPISYRALREHCHKMMELIDQLIVDSSSIVSHWYVWWNFDNDIWQWSLQDVILSDTSELGKQFDTTFYDVYFDDANAPFRRAKGLQAFWPGLFLRSRLPSTMTAGRAYQDPAHLAEDVEILPFSACLYHHHQAIALVVINVSYIIKFSNSCEYNLF